MMALEVSLERLDMLDGDILVILTNGVEAEEIPGWSSIPATSTGAVAVVDMAGATALNTPSPLSIPYGLEQIRPALETAAG